MTRTKIPAMRPGMTVGEKRAIRDDFCKQIRALLERKPMTVVDIAAAIGLRETTAYGYLCHMADIGEARRSSEVGIKNRQLWTLGREGNRPVKQMRPVLQPGVTVAPARQVGMWRDPLDVALFGPPGDKR